MFLLPRFLTLTLALVVSLCVSGIAVADVIPFSHTWTGTEPSGPNRLFRDGIPSMAPVAKAFPGTFSNNPTYFETLMLNVLPGSVVSVDITTATIESFLSIYEDPFDHLNLAANYLGDAGLSGVGTFSVLAPASGNVVIVASSVNGTGAIGSSFEAQVTFTPRQTEPVAPVPEPTSLAIWGLFGLVACAGGARLCKKKQAVS